MFGAPYSDLHTSYSVLRTSTGGSRPMGHDIFRAGDLTAVSGDNSAAGDHKSGYIGLFWANYIKAPQDKSIYFRNGGIWQQLCSERHNDESTVRHRDDRLELKFRDGLGDALYKNLSQLRFDEPFYYGLSRNHVMILMFDRTEGIRFTQSPSGGGLNKENQTTNPAWDFQY